MALITLDCQLIINLLFDLSFTLESSEIHSIPLVHTHVFGIGNFCTADSAKLADPARNQLKSNYKNLACNLQ